MRKAVLLIENGEEDVRAIKAAFRDANLFHPLNVVAAAAAAKDWLAPDSGRPETTRVSLVMVNIHDSKCEGLEFLKWLREQSYFPALLIVALTERSQLRDVVKAYERGAHTFFVKPVHMQDLKTLAKTYPHYCA
jgi:DNA-binding response OmpR family regulator